MIEDQGCPQRAIHTSPRGLPQEQGSCDKEESRRLDTTSSEHPSAPTREQAVRGVMKRHPRGNPLDFEDGDLRQEARHTRETPPPGTSFVFP